MRSKTLAQRQPAHGKFQPYRFDDDDKRYPKTTHRQLKLGDVLQVVSDARDCDEYQAMRRIGTTITTASILPEYKIHATVGKKVDYASFINPEQDKFLPNATKLIDKDCATATDNSINHTSFQRLLDRPISFSIETKRGAQTAQKAELQMGV
ncbi:hypothetical protein FVEG_17537 [Fusarium verticillioides 7600]|uniref:PD-(D/E)XK nuclease-like domain-containing protein n=1 Tax=Gibberella moniliformis (strain M3125 / FGSC 7600) TaxID=334819 RepID=W7N739_GIBM7|nr:hypothetical protein FVEG_17537 [Fusarium verticillioides 7600]EWG55519.1 hypothetical protein FVEG_17537 [Fusarium verticillioides 7600]